MAAQAARQCGNTAVGQGQGWGWGKGWGNAKASHLAGGHRSNSLAPIRAKGEAPRRIERRRGARRRPAAPRRAHTELAHCTEHEAVRPRRARAVRHQRGPARPGAAVVNGALRARTERRGGGGWADRPRHSGLPVGRRP
eukprot:gene465-biopygen6452